MNLQNKYANVQFRGINSNDDEVPQIILKMKERSNIEAIIFHLMIQIKKLQLYDASHTPHFFVFSKKILIYMEKFDDNWSDKSKVTKRT